MTTFSAGIRLEDELQRDKTPSAQYYFFNRDKVIYQFIDGLADVTTGKSVNEQTTYHAYSMTKPFTALAVLQLFDKGKLDIFAPVREYITDFTYGGQVTIKNLLNHTAGIPNPIPLNWIHLCKEHATFNRHEFFEGVIGANAKTKSLPNQKFSYSNLGYILLGELIESISGVNYEDYVTENVIEPLLLTSSDLAFEIDDVNLHAKGYLRNLSLTNFALGLFLDKSKFLGVAEKGWKPFNLFYVNGTPYGGLIGTPLAFVRFIQDLLNDHSKIVSTSAKKFFFTENQLNNGKNSGMCISWFTGKLKGKTYYTHAGGGGGYYCEMRIYPETGVGSVLFFNRTGMGDERFLDNLDINFL